MLTTRRFLSIRIRQTRPSGCVDITFADSNDKNKKTLITKENISINDQLNINSNIYTIASTYLICLETKNKIVTDFRYLLPKGFPDSVGRGYSKFVTFQMMALIMSTAGGVLSMQSLLYGLGIGASASLPLAATLNWVIKDGIGQLGGVIFAGLINTQFDTNPKQWRMLSGILMDVSSLFEILIPFAPTYFLPIAAIANVGKNISFLAASASRAAIHKSFARHENLADVTAKTASQSILSSTIGTVVGISISALVATDIYSVLFAYVVCSSLNLFWTHQSLRHVTLNNLNIERLDCMIHHFMSTNSILTPDDIRLEESVFLTTKKVQLPTLFIGRQTNEVFQTEERLKVILEIFSNRKYVINLEGNKEIDSKVFILFKSDASKIDVVKGLIHSYFVRKEFQKSIQENKINVDHIDILKKSRFIFNENSSMIKENINEEINIKSNLFLDKLFQENEWKIDELLLEPTQTRIEISEEKND